VVASPVTARPAARTNEEESGWSGTVRRGRQDPPGVGGRALHHGAR
jgi:hypothetical protein